MKKFLSLVLALIMTMSLVTISAGATEYRDLTDKDEIQYEEAVAVLNRIGVITGYDDGSFRPEGELTRGAAAKIIVSLLIGPDAASNLPNTTAPYPDVPASHTFAGVISYCKTAGIISGYGDGTFKPGNSLTGFAFAKMLLGALGYKSEVEGFIDTGWTMNVARVGNVVGLFDRLDFDGAASVNREQACQLALNTLKATMVTYGGTTMVTGAQNMYVQGTQAMYVTSNNREINANINRRVISAQNNEMTLEFGEEHFKDLRLEHDKFDPAYDNYGRPSNEWSYKKVTIGTFALPADFTFTKQMSHLEDTQATKEKALGLRGYDTYSTDHKANFTNWSSAAGGTYAYNSPFEDATQIHINGWNARVYNTEYKQGSIPAAIVSDGVGTVFTYDASKITASNKEEAPTLSEIADLTDNGVTVEVYVCPVDADFITDVVVIRTQLMEVDRVASDYVELKTVKPDSEGKTLAEIAGYNDNAIHKGVLSVKDNNYDAYNVLKDLKSGDEVAVIPYTADDGKTWEAGEVYVPETVSGVLTNVDIYNTNKKPDGNAIAITVGGTTYPIAQWNKDMREIDGYKIKASKKDVTLLLDKLGNALLAKDVAASDAWMIVGDYYQAAGASGRVGWFVHGWTIKGDEVDLDLGTIRGEAEKYAPGELVRYRVAEGGNGEYELTKPNYNQRAIWKNGIEAPWNEPRLQDGGKDTGEGIYTIAQYAKQDGVDKEYKIKSSNTLLPLDFYNTDKDKAVDYTVVEGDRFDYGKVTSLVPVGKTGLPTDSGLLTAATGFYDKKDNKGVSDSTGTDSYDHWFYKTAPYDGVKFIFVGFDSVNGEVETINFLNGVQNVEYSDLIQINQYWKNVGTNDQQNFVASPAEAYVDKNGKVKAVVIKSDSAEANLSDLMIITDNRGTNTSIKNGADEAPTSGTYYTRQYVSGADGFKEEKTGYFDTRLSVGTVLTGRLGDDGIIKSRVFHANQYTNRNPDGIYVKGIAPLKTLENKPSDYAFYVGAQAAVIDSTITNPKVSTLGTGVDGTSNLLTNDNKCLVLTGKDVLGVNDNTPKEGLIKVDSSTTWVDLRDGRLNDSDIDEIGDLFDLDNNKNIELKILLNGNGASDGFRHAYAVIVLKAEKKADDAAAATVTVNAKVEGKGANLTKTGAGTESNPIIFNVAPNTEIELTAKPNVTGTAEDAKWTVTAPTDAKTTENGNVITVNSGAENTVTKLEYYVVNHDADHENSVRTPKTVYVQVVAGKADTGDTYKLTLMGVLAGADQEVTVGANSTYITDVIHQQAANISTWTIPANASVKIAVKATAVIAAANKGTYNFGDGVEVTFTNTGDSTPYEDYITINKMSKDITINVRANADKPVGFDDKQVANIKVHGGIEGTWYPTAGDATAGTNGQALVSTEAGLTVPVGGTIIFSKVGDGKIIIPSVTAAGTTTADATNGWDKSNPGTSDKVATVNGSMEFWSATKLTVDDTLTAANTANSISVSDGNSYVATGIELAITKNATVEAAVKYTGATAPKSAAASAGIDKISLSGTDDIGLIGMVTLNLDDTRLKAEDADGAALANGSLVDTVSDVTVEAKVDDDHVVVKLGDGDTAPDYATGAGLYTAAAAVAKGDSFLGYTKVTLTQVAAGAVKYFKKVTGDNSMEVTIVSGAKTAEVYGFKPTTIVVNSGAATLTTFTVQVNGSAATTVTEKLDGVNLGTTVTIGEKGITIVEAA